MIYIAGKAAMCRLAVLLEAFGIPGLVQVARLHAWLAATQKTLVPPVESIVPRLSTTIGLDDT